MNIGVDYIGVGVGAVIVNSENKFFLSLRGKEVRNEAGKWEFPGGGVDFGEKLKDAIVREVREEYGVEIEIIDLLDIDDHIIPDEKQHWVAPTYFCRITSGTPKILEPHKCEQIGWFTIDEIENMNLTIISRSNLESLKKRLEK